MATRHDRARWEPRQAEVGNPSWLAPAGQAPGANPSWRLAAGTAASRLRCAIGLCAAVVLAITAAAGPSAAADGFFIHGPRDLGGETEFVDHAANVINDRNRIAGRTWDINRDGDADSWVQWVNSPWAHPRRDLIPSSIPADINNSGQILTGHFHSGLDLHTADGGRIHFSQSDGPDGYGLLGAPALNDHGTVAALVSPTNTSLDPFVALWHRGTWRVLGPGEPRDINNSGYVAGFGRISFEVTQAAIWRSDGPARTLPIRHPGAVASKATAITARGDVAGVVTDSAGRDRPVFWRRAVSTLFPQPVHPTERMYREIDAPPDASCSVEGINDHLVVVGWCATPDDPDGTAFAWHPDRGYTELPALPDGGPTRAYDINKAGWVVGSSGRHATIWRVLP